MTLATLLVPFKDEALDVTGKAVNEIQYEVTCGDSIYVILLGDGRVQTVGDFEFDGDMLCAEFDRNGTRIDCSGAQASLIKYQGKTILDSTVRQKIDSHINIQ